MADAKIEEMAEKKLKSRIRKLKKVAKDDVEKDKFFNQVGLSLEIFLPPSPRDSETLADSIILYTSPEGAIVDAEYSFSEEEKFAAPIPLADKDLDLIKEIFGDFKLE
ncbi:MAG: hypothetical protein ACRC1M_07285 [Methanobacteriaceae archaeon]